MTRVPRVACSLRKPVKSGAFLRHAMRLRDLRKWTLQAIGCIRRLEQAGVSTARYWMNRQSNYELSLARQCALPVVQKLSPAA